MNETMDILVLPGDGIGPEITAATEIVLREVNKRCRLSLNFRTEDIGFASLYRHGSTFPPDVFEAAQRSDGVILGPVSHYD